MKLTVYSRNRVFETFKRWEVPKEVAEPMYNYLVHGFNPGSCFTAVLANDFHGAISRSHPHNTVESLKALTGWIYDTVPRLARGNYKAVDEWCYLKDAERRLILERKKLIHTEQEEIMLTLKEVPTHEPVLY
jgi:hypothetical protein